MISEIVRPSSRAVAVLTATIGSVFLAGLLVVTFSHPEGVLAGMLLVCFTIAVLRFPILALGVFLLVAPFHGAIVTALQAKLHVGVGPLTYWRHALLIALFVRAAIARFWSDRRLLPWDPADSVLIAYVLVWILIAVVSPSRPGVGPSLLRYVEGPLLLLTIKFLRPSRKDVWRLASAMIAAATIMGGAALIEWIGPREKFQRWYGASPPANGELFRIGANGYRSGSFVYDPLIFTFYAAAATPFAVAATFVRTRWRMAAVFGAFACGAGLIVAHSRSGYIGGGIGVLAVIALAVRRVGMRVSLIGLAIVISGATILYYFTTGNETLHRTESDRAHKSALARDVDLVVARPFGYGLGTTDRSVYRTPSPGQIGYTESAYLAAAIEGGIPGLVLYLAVLFMTAMRVRAARLRAIQAGDQSGTVLAAGALGAMLAVAVAGLFLGVHELLIDMLLWGAPGLALAWPVLDHREPLLTST